jgi:hypothetical protein
MAPGPHDQVPHRLIITLCTVGATLMQALDQTIANVAPALYTGQSVGDYEDTWVLTSYIGAAIMTAPSDGSPPGWAGNTCASPA